MLASLLRSCEQCDRLQSNQNQSKPSVTTMGLLTQLYGTVVATLLKNCHGLHALGVPPCAATKLVPEK